MSALGVWLCPACGHGNEVTIVMTPAVGDVSFCLACARLLLFDRTGLGNIDLRLPSTTELHELLADPQVKAAVESARANLGPQQ